MILPEGEVEVKIVFEKAGSNLNYFRFKDPVAVTEEPFSFVSATTGEMKNEVFVTLNKNITAPDEITNVSDFILFVNGAEIAFDNAWVSSEEPRLLRFSTSEMLFSFPSGRYGHPSDFQFNRCVPSAQRSTRINWRASDAKSIGGERR